jgi:hypothetical protein
MGNKYQSKGLFAYNGLKKGYPDEGGFWLKTNLLDLSGGKFRVFDFIFPYIPEPATNVIDIIIDSRIKISQFRFPFFYGEISLKPIKTRFRIIP